MPNIILNDKRLNAPTTNIRNKTSVPALSTPIQHDTGSLSQCNKATKKIKFGKREIKLSVLIKKHGYM